MALTPEQARARAEAWRDALGQGETILSESTVGGGSLPDESLPTYVLALSVRSIVTFQKRLREADPPIIARVDNDNILLDPRTVLDDDLLLRTLKKVLEAYP